MALIVRQVVTVLAVVGAPESARGLTTAANPIRKVVTLLTKMQNAVKKESETEKASFDKYMCYCQTNGDETAKNIEDGKVKIDDLIASVKGDSEALAGVKSDLANHERGRQEAKGSLTEATGIRRKEFTDYSEQKAELDANIAAIQKAVTALEQGMSSSFLQGQASRTLRKFVIDKADLSDGNREELLEFLSISQDQEDYASSTPEIIGILKQLQDSMSVTRSEMISTEKTAITQFHALEAAKKKELVTLTQQIEEGLMRMGEMSVGVATLKEELEDTQEQLQEDTKFSAEIAENCKTKTAEYEALKKSHATELVALGDTIKMLASDDSLELMKKTLNFQQTGSSPGSFLQTRMSSKSKRKLVTRMMRRSRRRHKRKKGGGHPYLDLVELALNGHQRGFNKVLLMIDHMIQTLETDQHDDDTKKDYCEKKFDITEDKQKNLGLKKSDTQAVIDKLKGELVEIKEDIAAVKVRIKDLDKAVDEATVMRKDDHKAYKSMMAADGSAKGLLVMAKNRLNQMYNPSLASSAALAQSHKSSTDDVAEESQPGDDGEDPVFLQISSQSSDGDSNTDSASEGASYTGRDGHNVGSGTESRKQKSAGVIQLLDELVQDLDREMQIAKVEDKDAQRDYESMMKEARRKRVTDTKALTEKEAVAAQIQDAIETQRGARHDTMRALMDQNEYMRDLHLGCDWLLQKYDMRKAARADEIDALGKAKGVLHGAQS